MSGPPTMMGRSGAAASRDLMVGIHASGAAVTKMAPTRSSNLSDWPPSVVSAAVPIPQCNPGPVERASRPLSSFHAGA